MLPDLPIEDRGVHMTWLCRMYGYEYVIIDRHGCPVAWKYADGGYRYRGIPRDDNHPSAMPFEVEHTK